MIAEETVKPAWASSWYERLADIELGEAKRVDFGLLHRGLTYACELTRERGGDRLFVSLRGFKMPGESLPLFSRQKWLGKELGGHVLAITDPTLFLDESQTTGAFVGSLSQDPIDGITRLARLTAQRLGVRRDRIVYWGSSAGGFGALMCAIRTGGTAVAMNSQIDLRLFQNSWVAGAIAHRLRPGYSPADAAAEFGDRLSVEMALRKAYAQGVRPRFVLGQNVQDRVHFRKQYKPFCEHMGWPEDGVSSGGEIVTFTFSAEGGHAASFPEEIRPRLEEGLKLIEERADAERRARREAMAEARREAGRRERRAELKSVRFALEGD